MAQKLHLGLTDLILFSLVVAVAAGARAGYLLGMADRAHSDGPLVVQAPSPRLSGLPPGTEFNGSSAPTEQDALVHNLKEFRWFGSLAPFADQEERTAHTSPGYPWLLAMLGRLVSAPNDAALARWIQCGLGALAAGLYFLFARLAFRSRPVATLAGLLCALYPYWIINTAALNDGTLTAFTLAAALCLGALASQTGGAFASLLYGLALAGLALLRAPLLPFAFVAVLWFLLRTRRLERGWLCALLAFLGFANGLGPWTLRNFQAFGEPMPLVDSAYLHLWMGNNDAADGGPQSEETMLATLAQRRGESAASLRKELAAVPQPRRYRSLAADVAGDIRDHPAETLRHRLEAGECFLFGATWMKYRRVAEVADDANLPDWVARSYAALLLLVLLVLLPLALLGWRWTYPWRHEAMPSSLALIWIPLPYLLSHGELLHGPRLPLDGVLLTYAAFALACVWPATARKLFKGPRTEEAEEEKGRSPRA
jgi:4-amino-4-deoxy-L-arabinose transferase-like glycosyltransferase